jgi:hypothetical protein
VISAARGPDGRDGPGPAEAKTAEPEPGLKAGRHAPEAPGPAARQAAAPGPGVCAVDTDGVWTPQVPAEEPRMAAIPPCGARHETVWLYPDRIRGSTEAPPEK